MAKRTLVRFNPATVSTFDTDSKDPEAAVMGTLNTFQLWKQADNGNEWAMWELQRRNITSLPARPNPAPSDTIYTVTYRRPSGEIKTLTGAKAWWRKALSEHGIPGDIIEIIARRYVGDYTGRPKDYVQNTPMSWRLDSWGDLNPALARSNPQEPDVALWLERDLQHVQRNITVSSGQHGMIVEVPQNPHTPGLTKLTIEKAVVRVLRGPDYRAESIEMERYPNVIRIRFNLPVSAARSNPQGMNMTMILGEEDSRHSLGGEWARWAEDREGIMRRNPRALRNNGGKRIIHTSSGCTGRGYWLSVVELDEGRHTAKVLYNARRDDYDVHDPYPANANRYVKPPGESIYFIMDRGLDDVGNKVVLGGYSPIVSGVTQAPIPRSEYPIEGPFFVSSYPGVAGNEWRQNPRAQSNPKAKFGADGGYFFGSEEGYMYRPWIEIDGVRRNLKVYASHKKGAIADARKAAAYADIRGGFATFRKKP